MKQATETGLGTLATPRHHAEKRSGSGNAMISIDKFVRDGRVSNEVSLGSAS